MPRCAAAYSVCKARQTRGGIRDQVAAAEFVLVEQLSCVGRLHLGIALRMRAQDGRKFSPFRFGQALARLMRCAESQGTVYPGT